MSTLDDLAKKKLTEQPAEQPGIKEGLTHAARDYAASQLSSCAHGAGYRTVRATEATAEAPNGGAP